MAEVTVLGIGNTLMRDDGVGVRLMEAVRDSRPWADSVEFIDGGAGGLGLLSVIESARGLAVFDCVELGLLPGRHRIIDDEQIASEPPEHRLSLHDLSFLETLRLSRLESPGPEKVAILAIQPGAIDFGRELSAEVQAAFAGLVEAGISLVDSLLERMPGADRDRRRRQQGPLPQA
jgi:hydrogenase maturation protease